MLLERIARETAIAVMVHGGARRADDPCRIGQLACELAVIERRQQLALGEVSGAAKDDIVERVDRNDLAHWGASCP
jgi:hypothetical protein